MKTRLKCDINGKKFYLYIKLFFVTSFSLSNKMAYGLGLQNLPVKRQFKDGWCQLKHFAFVVWEQCIFVVDFDIKVVFTINYLTKLF